MASGKAEGELEKVKENGMKEDLKGRVAGAHPISQCLQEHVSVIYVCSV